MADIAKVFQSAGSQAVRLPKQYRFADDEVLIYREGNRVVLESRRAEWSEQFLSLAGTAAEFSYPDEPLAVEPVPFSVGDALPSRHKRLRRLPQWALPEGDRKVAGTGKKEDGGGIP